MIKKPHYYSMALLLIFVVLSTYAYYSLIKTVWKKASLVSSYNSDIVFGDQKKQYAGTMLRSFEDAQVFVDRLQGFFVKKQGEVEFIEFIEKTARQKGLEIGIDTVSLDSPPVMAKHGMEYLVLRLYVSGNWSQVWNFSQTLEVLPYSIDVNSVALLRGETGSTTTALWKGVYSIRVLKKK